MIDSMNEVAADATQVKDIEESAGVVSMMRVVLKESVKIAKWMLIFDAALCAAMLFLSRYELSTVALALAAGAPGMISVGAYAKSQQSKAENPAPARGYNP
jgi:ABC-type transport system involved in cytochrome c biogenesis permease component